MDNPSIPLDASARAVLERARDEAARLHHDHVGTEHLALALLRLPLIANRLVQELGIDTEQARAAIESAVAPGAPGAEPDGSLPFTTRTNRVCALAQQHALALGETAIGAEHLLVGLLQEPGIGGQVLAGHGLSADAVLAALRH